MALFNRNKKSSVLPEIDKYYDGERRDRTGLAWLLALISVGAVTLLVVGLFLGGRWAYRALTDDSSDVAVVQNGDEEIIPDFDGVVPPSEGEDTPAPSDENEQTESENEPTQQPVEEEQGTVQAPVRTDTPSSIVATGDDPLPKTGPASVASVFLVTSSLAGGAHYITTRKRK